MRPADLADAPALAELEHELFPEDAWSLAMLRDEIAHPSRHVVVVEVADGSAPRPRSAGPIGTPLEAASDAPSRRIIGYAAVMLLGDSADLHTIGTTRPGRGVGRALLDWALRTTREDGASALLLEVREDNTRARHVYEAAGFRDIGARRGYYPGPDGPVDARVMIRELPTD
ncbi:GNAT family N-acetyltransferase [Brachybacterium endophyticum]|nr:GNAT family N-acetyltransferase [Brachybacterium endophyticum]